MASCAARRLMASEVDAALKNGVGFTTTMLLKDTSHRTVFRSGSGARLRHEGLRARPTWSCARSHDLPGPAVGAHSGWMLCDIYFADGRPSAALHATGPASTLSTQADRGYDFVPARSRVPSVQAGEGPARDRRCRGQPASRPDVSLLNQGYQYLTEQRYDEMDPIMEILRTNLVDLGLPPAHDRSRVRPSQVEFTFRTGHRLDPPTRWCCSAAPPSRSPSATASTLVHVPAEARQT